MSRQNSIEMTNFKVNELEDEASERMLPEAPTANENKLQDMTLIEMKLYDQRKSYKLYINFIVIFIMSSLMLFYNFTNTFSCTGDSVTSCYPQFSMQIHNTTTRAEQILNTADECLKMISFFATSFNSNKGSSVGDDTTGSDGSNNFSDMLDSILAANKTEGVIQLPTESITQLPNPIGLVDQAELERLKGILDALQMKPPKKREVTDEFKLTRNVYGGLDLNRALADSKSDDDTDAMSEDNAVDLLAMLDLILQANNSTDDSTPANKTESGIQTFMNDMLSNVDSVLESKGLLDVIDTFSTLNTFEFNHNGYCRINKSKKTKFCTFSKGLDVFSVLIQDVGFQLASLVQSTDANQLSESMLTTYYNAVVAMSKLYDKGNKNVEGFGDLDLDSLKSVKSLKNSKSFSKFSSHCSWFMILLSISITILTGNILLSFTVENVKFFDSIQINLHQYVLKILLGFVSIKLIIEFIIFLGEFYAIRRYSRFFSYLEIAEVSSTWGFYFTLMNIVFGLLQLVMIHRMIIKFEQFLR